MPRLKMSQRSSKPQLLAKCLRWQATIWKWGCQSIKSAYLLLCPLDRSTLLSSHRFQSEESVFTSGARSMENGERHCESASLLQKTCVTNFYILSNKHIGFICKTGTCTSPKHTVNDFWCHRLRCTSWHWAHITWWVLEVAALWRYPIEYIELKHALLVLFCCNKFGKIVWRDFSSVNQITMLGMQSLSHSKVNQDQMGWTTGCQEHQIFQLDILVDTWFLRQTLWLKPK